VEGFAVMIENIDSSTVLGSRIPLNKLVAKVGAAQYEPEQFPGIIYRLTDPRAASLIFSSGKIFCTGTKSIEDARKAVSKVVEKVSKAGIKVPRSYDVRIDNIVAATRMDSELNLEEVSFSLDGAEYDPEAFPGVVYRLNEPRATFVLSGSGRILCTGAQSVDEIYEALDMLRHNLESIGIAVNPASE